MSKQTKKDKAPVTEGAFTVAPIQRKEDDSLLKQEPLFIINEIIENTNAFAATDTGAYDALLYLGFSQRYALRFINQEGILDPMKGTFAGVKVIWVEAPYHVNLVRVSKPMAAETQEVPASEAANQ